MKSTIFLFLSIILSCQTVPQPDPVVIQEVPEYMTNRYGVIVFRDWDTAFKYAEISVVVCKYLIDGCKYNIKIYTESGNEYYIEKWTSIMKQLENIYIIFHSGYGNGVAI